MLLIDDTCETQSTTIALLLLKPEQRRTRNAVRHANTGQSCNLALQDTHRLRLKSESGTKVDSVNLFIDPIELGNPGPFEMNWGGDETSVNHLLV
jgi:hypothetical protein